MSSSTCFTHPLVQLTINPSNITAWHAFLLFHSSCLSFPSQGGEKGHQKTHTHLRNVHGKGLTDIIKGTYN